MREHGTSGIDDQSWDVSVKSVAHYQSALNMMADKGDWTATLGRAYAYQSSEVMGAVQRMRRLADAQGNLVSSSQQQVVRESENYVIVPAQPRVIYVPVYDPVIVYTQPIFGPGFSSRLWSFGVGFPIGGWLNYDLDWRRRSVYYNGWDEAYFGYGGGWRFRSRPFIQFTTVYVSPRFLNVQVNRNVAYRSVNYHNVDRYAGYHRDVLFETRRDGYRDGYRDGRGDGRYDGRNNDGRYGGRYDDRDRNAPNRDNVGRTAQPRSDGATVSPDGYRNGLPQREAVRGDGRDAPRGDPRGGPQGEASSPRQAAPSERRQEPAARRMSPRAAEPRPAQPQASEPRSAPTRTAQPRGGSDGSRGSRERRGG